MSAEYDIAINLVSAGIGALAGASWTYTANKVRYRHHRVFWRFMEKPTVFVVGDLTPNVLLDNLPDVLMEILPTALRDTLRQQDLWMMRDRIMLYLDDREISGLVGRGDLDAIVSMVAKFSSMRFPAKPVVIHPAEVRDRVDHNLVLIGGKDTNSLTGIMAPLLGCRLDILMNEGGSNVVRDLKLNVEYPVARPDHGNGPGEILDHGILVRGRNPYNSEREILMIAGAHGLGSSAAAEVCLNPRFEKRLYSALKEYKGNFECLVSYKRVNGGPADGQVTIDLEFSRGLSGER